MILKSTFFSFDALKSKTNKRVNNILLLMNVKRNASNQSIKKVKVYDPINNNIMHEFLARENLISIHRLSSLDKNTYNKKTNFFSCNDCVFIPILFSIDVISKQLSLEHTHPPHEMLWGSDREKAVNLIKQQWVL